MPFESGGTLFNRVRLEGHKTKADIVLGLDNFVLEEAKKSKLFDINHVDLSKLSLPTQWQDNTFVVYNLYLEQSCRYDLRMYFYILCPYCAVYGDTLSSL